MAQLRDASRMCLWDHHSTGGKFGRTPSIAQLPGIVEQHLDRFDTGSRETHQITGNPHSCRRRRRMSRERRQSAPFAAPVSQNRISLAR